MAVIWIGCCFIGFFPGEDRGELLLPLRAQVVEGAPITLRYPREKEAQTAVADPHGSRCPAVDVFPVEEVLLEFFLGIERGVSGRNT